MRLTWALPAFAPGSRVPVPSGLSRRHRGRAHDHGNSAAYKLRNYHEKRNPCRSGRAPRAGAAYQPTHGHHAPLKWTPVRPHVAWPAGDVDVTRGPLDRAVALQLAVQAAVPVDG